MTGEPLPDVDNFTRGFVRYAWMRPCRTGVANALLSRSEKFNVTITPRSAHKAEMMRSEGHSALTEMSTLYD